LGGGGRGNANKKAGWCCVKILSKLKKIISSVQSNKVAIRAGGGLLGSGKKKKTRRGGGGG